MMWQMKDSFPLIAAYSTGCSMCEPLLHCVPLSTAAYSVSVIIFQVVIIFERQPWFNVPPLRSLKFPLQILHATHQDVIHLSHIMQNTCVGWCCLERLFSKEDSAVVCCHCTDEATPEQQAPDRYTPQNAKACAQDSRCLRHKLDKRSGQTPDASGEIL